MQQRLLLPAVLFMSLLAHAQSDPAPAKMKQFNVNIRLTNGKILSGNLKSVNDSQLVLASRQMIRSVRVETINSFTMKRKNSALKGALIGFGAGMLTGVIIGFASGDDLVLAYPDNDTYGLGSVFVALNNAFAMTAAQKAVLGGLSLGTTGGIMGAVIGAVAHKKFVIGGKRERFHDLQNEVMLKLVRK